MLNTKYIYKYMRLAKQVGEDSNECLARSIGSVIVNPEVNAVVSVGLNGPPTKTPHCNTAEYLELFWDKLTNDEDKLYLKYRGFKSKEEFLEEFTNGNRCPRRILDIPSGHRLDLCSCAHSEANALVNASKVNSSTQGCYIFCWCTLPCAECTKLIINAGITKVYCLSNRKGEPDYSVSSRWLFEHANIEIVELEQGAIIQ